MGTRSLTHVVDEDGHILVTIYRQFDGYPTGNGKDIADFLRSKKLVNGYQEPDKGSGKFPLLNCNCNGMGDLAAQLVAHLKMQCEYGIGHTYIQRPGAKDTWENYTYRVYPSGPDARQIRLHVKGGEETLYDGPVKDFDAKAIEEKANQE